MVPQSKLVKLRACQNQPAVSSEINYVNGDTNICASFLCCDSRNDCRTSLQDMAICLNSGTVKDPPHACPPDKKGSGISMDPRSVVL